MKHELDQLEDVKLHGASAKADKKQQTDAGGTGQQLPVEQS